MLVPGCKAYLLETAEFQKLVPRAGLLGWVTVTSPLSLHMAHQLGGKIRQEACFLPTPGPWASAPLFGGQPCGEHAAQEAESSPPSPLPPAPAPGIIPSALALSEVTGPPAGASLGVGPGVGILHVVGVRTKV